MKTIALPVLVAVGLVASPHLLQGQDRSRYRDFQLGSDVLSVSALAGVAASEAKTIHQRPAVMQELEWTPPYSLKGPTVEQNDPVRQIVFSFYDDQLSRMIVDYSRERTEGMTVADMIDALSTTYGPVLAPAPAKTRAVRSRLDEESGTPVARWGDADYSVVLYRLSYLSGFRVIIASPRLEALARSADARAIVLDDREAPQRAIERQKKEAEDTRVSEDKARTANKAAFRP